MPDVLVVPDSIARRADPVPTPPAFECSWTDAAVDVGWVHVAGELDIATTPELERALRESYPRGRLVVLDLRELEFIDSSGVHAIVNASLCARQTGRRLVVLSGPPNVDRMFALTGTADGVEIGEVSSLLALIEEKPV
jgi:anti-anti-sigma factor